MSPARAEFLGAEYARMRSPRKLELLGREIERQTLLRASEFQTDNVIINQAIQNAREPMSSCY